MKGNEEKELTRLEALREMIEASPLTQQVRAEKAAKDLSLRQEAALEIEALQTEQSHIIPPLQADVTEKEDELKKHDEQRKVILDRLSMAKRKLAVTKGEFEHKIGRAKNILLGNYHPIIDETGTFFRDLQESLRRKTINYYTHAGKTNVFTMTKKQTIYSNADAIKSALTYCRMAIEELERMKLTPEVNIERIEALKKGIPDVSEMQEISVDKLLSRPPDPLAALPSDDQLAWNIGKLNEKFKKLMGRP